MKWIGLTGGIGSGKSTVGQILREMGYSVVDADQLAHRVLMDKGPAQMEIRRIFGDEILNSKGEIDRRKLGRVVFSDPGKLSQLESIVHPAVRQRSLEERRKLDAKGVSLAFYDVPLLFEKNLQNDFDSVVVVYASPEDQISRTMARSSMSREMVESRLARQLPLAEKLVKAHFVIDNTGDPSQLKVQVADLVRELAAHQAQT